MSAKQAVMSSVKRLVNQTGTATKAAMLFFMDAVAQ
jgi:hypothetical protein